MGREIIEKESSRGDASERHLGGIWEASGKHLRRIWEASGRHLGGIWEASGRHLGGIWEYRRPWGSRRLRMSKIDAHIS